MIVEIHDAVGVVPELFDTVAASALRGLFRTGHGLFAQWPSQSLTRFLCGIAVSGG